VENEHRGGYVREAFGYPADLDGDGCDTRDEVLMTESIAFVDVQSGCFLASGQWWSLYDGVTMNSPSEIEIDHMVSLKEAWDSGAWAWDPLTMVAFGNDLTDTRTLRGVSSASNQDKGEKDPSNWVPSEPTAVCPDLGEWVAIKARWSLSMDQSEFGRIRNLLNGPCAGTSIAGFEPVPATAGYRNSPYVPAPVMTVPFLSVPSGGGGDAYYANCDAARAAGAAPLNRGDPGYRSGLDRDDDGVACE